MTTITLPRTVVEQALEVINDTAYGAPVFRQEVRDTITALRDALAQQAEPVDSGYWGRVAARQASRIKQLETTAQQALEALEWHLDRGTWGADIEGVTGALRAALAQEQAEPQRTSAWWRDGLTATLMREGVNKHRAREIADGYWQAYCEIGGNDD